MKSIYTYVDPFRLKDDINIRNMFHDYPNFCASDTLVQGLIECYHRDSFNIIQTVNDLQRMLVGEVTNKASFDMQLFLDISHIIREKEKDESIIANAFRNNISSVVTAVKWLLFMDCDTSFFYNSNEFPSEQKLFLEIFDLIKERYKKTIQGKISLDKEEVIEMIKKSTVYEAEFLIKRNMNNSAVKDYRCRDCDEAIRKLEKIKDELNDSIMCRPVDDTTSSSIVNDSLRRVSFLLDLIKNNKEKDFNKIVIHGVHKFTPELLLTIDVIEKAGIDVLFLINYAQGLPIIYDTWKTVYEWTGCEFENKKSIDLSKGNPIGRDIANVYLGKKVADRLDVEMCEFENLSSFATDEVKQEFSRGNESLGRMKTQYYAVDNTDTNEILKHYFPEQFECKPFLSYPIGQFILGIYNMWDFDRNELAIKESSLRECVNSGIYISKRKRQLIDIFENIWPFISPCEYANGKKGAYSELENLKKNIECIERNKNLHVLRHISFYSLSCEDVDELYGFIKYIDSLANRIFMHKGETARFDQHFRNMVSILSEQVNESASINQVEQELVAKIWEAINDSTDSIEGDFGDVREALNYYLTQKNADDSSNWIVRNFEQIDGAVLLSRRTHAKKYHFALMSIKNMAKNNKEVYPWPISEEMLNCYASENLRDKIYACVNSMRERTGFLKYSLFYGAFFSQRRVEFSYVRNQNGERQRPYYILNILKLKEKSLRSDQSTILEKLDQADEEERLVDLKKLTDEDYEFFEVCNYRFFINTVVKDPVIYSNDYQIKYFLTNSLSYMLSHDSAVNLDNVKDRTRKYIEYFEPFFPMFDDVVFKDIEKNVVEATNKSLNYRINNPDKRGNDRKYERRKTNFLSAKWEVNGENMMKFDRPKEEVGQEIKEYMVGEDMYTTMPYKVICDNCCNNSKCLLSYYSRLREGEA